MLKNIFVLLVISKKLKRLINIAIFWGLTPLQSGSVNRAKDLPRWVHIYQTVRRHILAKRNITTAAIASNPIKTNGCSKIENIRHSTSTIIPRINTINRNVHFCTGTKLVVIKILIT
jgi:hypothetical protein